MKFFFFALVFIISTAHAAKLEDVQVLDMKYYKESFAVKLQLKDGKNDSYFTVQIAKDDEKSFEKIAMVLKKVKQKESFKLNLDIPSFSPQTGSFYKSNYVTFTGTVGEESLLRD